MFWGVVLFVEGGWLENILVCVDFGGILVLFVYEVLRFVIVWRFK